MIPVDEIAIRSYSLTVTPEGETVFPQEFLRGLNLRAENSMLLFQIGDLVLLLPHQAQVSNLAVAFMDLMEEKEVSLDNLLNGLVEEREEIWKALQND